jgi:hypothetical protein
MIRRYKGTRKENLGGNAMAENPASDPTETLLGYLPYLTLRDSAGALKTWLQVWLAMLAFLGLAYAIWMVGLPYLGLDVTLHREWLSDLWAATPFWVWFPAFLGFMLWANRGDTWVFPYLSAKACIGFALIWMAILFALIHTTLIAAAVLFASLIAALLTLEYFQDVGQKNYEQLRLEQHIDNN